jgi:hypothetical protein
MTEPALSFVGVWTTLIALGVILYVLLDGFDLGVGMLHGFAHDAVDREVIMTRSRRSGTATRPGWCFAVSPSSRRFRWLLPLSYRPYTFRSW